jgi:hypothetical protein
MSPNGCYPCVRSVQPPGRVAPCTGFTGGGSMAPVKVRSALNVRQVRRLLAALPSDDVADEVAQARAQLGAAQLRFRLATLGQAARRPARMR